MNLNQTLNYRKELGPTHPDTHYATVLIDFDGVLSESSGPYERNHFGPPSKEGLKLLRLCLQHKYSVVIFTARKETDSVAKWLDEHGFPNMLVTNHKIPASAYVDDRAIPWNSSKSTARKTIKYIRNPKAVLDLTV